MEAQQSGGDGGGREFQRVADELRARMTDGTYPLHAFLPSQRDLAEEFGVSRDTVQRVLRELVNEGWIESRQGSGSRVVKTQRIQSSTPRATRQRHGATLGPLLSEAFEQPEVTLDAYTLTSESLDAHIRLQAERILGGSIAPERIGLRMILPSEDLHVPYPRVRDDKEDPRLRDRLHDITNRHTESLRGVLKALKTEKHVESVDVQIRHAPLTPAFKLYLFNGAEALLGPYEVIQRQIELESGEEITALDVLGLGATLTHHVKDADPNSSGTVFVDSWQAWFDSVWNLLAE
ncbi:MULTISPECIES: winged helix-turn-helix domain-containing protein [unclassified Streptomyces]|uniref:winged helix-turn-helix domain-containing protein n=1 Tax=unclassified Streptomyces TaxID=2593676 RepID=UPI00090AEE8D|nr:MULTISPECIES: winged helix-turn-helix domain-containing protein [unclassified Streptomyces]MDX3245434.1 winged helix-turn-helix domain-containing protein [Streptomyces sp. ME18-1-4]SHI17550.1 transcriptional regulator, GntR family [Streptomyces sp. 3214.6]